MKRNLERQRGRDDTPKEIASRTGLGFGDIIAHRGTVWLPYSLVKWTPLPHFEGPRRPPLALGAETNIFQRGFRTDRTIVQALNAQGRVLQGFLNLLRGDDAQAGDDGAIKYVFNIAVDLIAQSYIKEVFAILRARGAPHLTQKQEDKAARGVFTFDIVRRALRAEPIIALACVVPKGTFTYFRGHRTREWWDRIFELFALNNDKKSPRGWDNKPFRQLTRQLHTAIKQELQRSARFARHMHCHMGSRLLIILHYDHDHLSVMWKAFPQHSKHTQDKISGISNVEKTNWLMP